mgnify:CR=1 FL=1
MSAAAYTPSADSRSTLLDELESTVVDFAALPQGAQDAIRSVIAALLGDADTSQPEADRLAAVLAELALVGVGRLVADISLVSATA